MSALLKTDPAASDAARLRQLGQLLVNRQGELADLARRTESPTARAALLRVGASLGRAVAELGSAQTAITADRGRGA